MANNNDDAIRAALGTLAQTINGIATNPKDPLWKSAPERAHHLHEQFSRAADKFAAQDIINASGSLLIAVFRQTYPDRAKAEAAFNETFGRMKQLLVEQYDGAKNRHQGVYPFDQHLFPGVLKNTNRFPPTK